MLGRVAAVRPVAARARCATTNRVVQKAVVSRRGMATEKQLRTRLTSITNIRKITKAMKLVAASKLRQVERLLDGARNFAAPMTNSWPEDVRDPNPAKVHLIVPMSGDRGLCGAVNSVIARGAKAQIKADKEANRQSSLFIVGEKAKGALERSEEKIIQGAVTELGKSGAPSFQEISLITEHILSCEYDQVTFIYNVFKSAVAYETENATQLAAEKTDLWNKFEFEGEQRDALANIYEFRMAVQMFHFVIEGATSEQSARMSAMDSSTNNAGDMIDKLRLQYNRTRQSRITTELIEIISGATAAAEMK